MGLGPGDSLPSPKPKQKGEGNREAAAAAGGSSSSGAGVGWGVPPVIPGEGQRGKINDHTKANSPKRAQSRALFTDVPSRIIDAIKSPLSHQEPPGAPSWRA